MTTGRPDTSALQPPAGVQLSQPGSPSAAAALMPEALDLVADLHRTFNPRRLELLERRARVAQELDRGALPDFLPETAHIRAGDWTIAPIPAEVQDRRVEITGPVDRKMVINALNSGAKVFMADFEDSHAPTWEGTLAGQVNLHGAVRHSLTYTSPEGKPYALSSHIATLMVRPRGWHLPERHVRVDGQIASGALFDFAVFMALNARELVRQGRHVLLYLPKLENHLEARLWNDVFLHTQRRLGLPVGTVRATVLIETILAAFEMDEILYELREHALGLNCGRWDYIFSFIKKLGRHSRFVLPDRAEVTMDKAFLRAYSLELIRTCHRRGAFAMGGMAAQIPIRNDPAASEVAVAKVRADKLREVTSGHDGTWVAHPGLVPVAMEVFNEHMPSANQIATPRAIAPATQADLLKVHEGHVTQQGLRTNIAVGVRYLESWLRGVGCVPINNLMEDAATAEICRAQVWQWIRHALRIEDGRVITPELVAQLQQEELDALRRVMGPAAYDAGRFAHAGQLFGQMATSREFVEFLTLPAYDQLPDDPIPTTPA